MVKVINNIFPKGVVGREDLRGAESVINGGRDDADRPTDAALPSSGREPQVDPGENALHRPQNVLN